MSGDCRRPLRYRGENRRGVAVAGTLGPRTSLLDHVEDLYRKGWRWLSVEDGGEEVGGIGLHPDTGKRVWWGDSGPTYNASREGRI